MRWWITPVYSPLSTALLVVLAVVLGFTIGQMT